MQAIISNPLEVVTTRSRSYYNGWRYIEKEGPVRPKAYPYVGKKFVSIRPNERLALATLVRYRNNPKEMEQYIKYLEKRLRESNSTSTV